MEVNTYTQGDVTILEVIGEVDGSTAPTLQEHVLAVAQPGVRLLMNVEQINYMSSAGLRIMLLLYRRISGGIGKVVLVGLSDPIRDTMSATGFLKYFTTAETMEDGLLALD